MATVYGYALDTDNAGVEVQTFDTEEARRAALWRDYVEIGKALGEDIAEPAEPAPTHAISDALQEFDAVFGLVLFEHVVAQREVE